MVTADHSERLENKAKTRRCGHPTEAARAKTPEIPGKTACLEKRGVGGRARKCEFHGKTQFPAVKPPANEVRNDPNEANFGAFSSTRSETDRQPTANRPQPGLTPSWRGACR